VDGIGTNNTFDYLLVAESTVIEMHVPNAPEYHDSVGNLAIDVVCNTAPNLIDRQIWVGPLFLEPICRPKHSGERAAFVSAGQRIMYGPDRSSQLRTPHPPQKKNKKKQKNCVIR
jgi:hypothetical protein